MAIRGREDAEVLVSNAIKNCPQLQHVILKHCSKLSDDCLAALSDSNCGQDGAENSSLSTGIFTLDLEGTAVSTHWGISQVTKLSKLRSLNLFNCRYFDSLHLLQLAYNCKHLERLNLEEVTHLSDESVTVLLLERRETLKALHLDGESLTDASLSNLFICTKLEELGICFAEEMDLQGIESVSKLNNLRMLKLKRAKKVTASAFVDMFSGGQLACLTSLDLSECALLNNECLFTIASNCPLLEHLVLNWCWEVSDEGMISIVEACKNLIKMYLVGVVLLTDDFLDSMDSPLLTYLDVQQCPNFTDSKLELLVKLCDHDLTIVNYYGEVIQKETHKENEVNSDKSSEASSTTEGAISWEDISDGFSDA